MAAPCKKHARERPSCRLRRSQARKRQQDLGGRGYARHLRALHVTAANAQERKQVGALAVAVQEATGENVELAWVDQGYTGPQAAQAAAEHGMRLTVVKLDEAKQGFVLLPDAGWSGASSAESPAAVAWPVTTNDHLRPSRDCAGSCSPGGCLVAYTSSPLSAPNKL